MNIGNEILLEVKKRELNLCPEFTSQLINITNYSQLASMYFKGSDWSMENDFPNISLLRKHKTELLPYGMMTDIEESIINKRYLALFGNSNVSLKYTGFSIGELIIRNNSKALIEVSDNANLTIDILDDASVNIICKDNAKVVVCAYHNANITSSGAVMIYKKSFK